MKKRLAGASQGDVSQRSLEVLREVSAILDAKAPSEAAAFKAWLRSISTSVAEAASEGGVLGFGGTKVSEKEKATLSDIAKALGITSNLQVLTYVSHRVRAGQLSLVDPGVVPVGGQAKFAVASTINSAIASKISSAADETSVLAWLTALRAGAFRSMG